MKIQLPTNFKDKSSFLSCFRFTPNIDDWSDEDFCEFFDHVIRMRHDGLHFCLSHAFFKEWIPEKCVSEVFHGYDSVGKDQTPDIMIEFEGKIYLIDVAISSNYSETCQRKSDHYSKLVKGLSTFTKKEVIFIPFIIDMGNFNFETEYKKIEHIIHRRELDLPFFNQVLNIYSVHKRLINENVSKEALQKHIKLKYNFEENIGYILDTKIDNDLLDSIYNRKYPHEIPNYREEEDIIQFSKEFLESSAKEDFLDTKNDPRQYDEAFKLIEKNQKKFIEKKHITFYHFLPEVGGVLETHAGNFSEQKMVVEFAKHLSENKPSEENKTKEYGFVMTIMEEVLNVRRNKHTWEKFCTGKFFKNEEDYKDDFTKNRLKGEDFQSYLVRNKEIDEGPKIRRKKSIVVPKKMMDPVSIGHYLDSGNEFYKDRFKEVKPKRKKTQKMKDSIEIEKLITRLCSEDLEVYSGQLETIRKYLLYDAMKIPDSKRCQKIKSQCVKEYEPIVDYFMSKNYSKVLWHAHLFYSQLMHILSYTDKNSQYTFINCGNPNQLTLILGGYKSKDTQYPKAFMEMVITTKPELYPEELYGMLSKIKLDDGSWLVLSGWRRVNLEKCTFMRDSFYSVFSTSVSFLENIGLDKAEYFDEITSIKTIISICPKQQIQELLMDCRYAIMSSFSIYTNIGELLKSKFSPPYFSSLSCWIINRLRKVLPMQTDKILNQEGTILAPAPKFNGEQVKEETKGGKINLLSIWTDHKVDNIEQILEETFIYTHTMKEPSNLYHEKVKAINTIIKFQKEFEQAGKEKYGFVENKEEMWEFCNSRFSSGEEKYIGFSGNVIYNSFKSLLSRIKPDFKKIINDVLSESIGEVLSTKAVIHDVGRNYTLKDEEKRSMIKRIYKRIRKTGLVEQSEFEEFYTDYISSDKKRSKFILDNLSKYYKVKARQKVWETILDVLVENEELETVEDFLIYYLDKEAGEMEADICIKAQYGSKREFYVVNIGCKIYARIIEKFFYYLCCDCNSECISIPGDKKMLSMQEMLDKATYYASTRGMKMVYVNGDCTKWSAAETMGSFMMMAEVLKEHVPEGFYKLLRTGFSLWADKKINIPIDIVEKVIPMTPYLTEMLQEGNINMNKPQIHSTQNFLQGMFNYASSLKASSCNYYIENIWCKIRPESRLRVFHMEHSDDYVQVICFDNVKELEDFRALFKIFMKFHGYNDSARKTSCQSFFMEFVSLMSFNGNMLYPKIKKTKEINLSLPCTSYKDDIESGLSRSGECLRMGCSISFCYFFQRLHNYCIREAYSLLEGMTNYLGSSTYYEPIEMFGTPDQLPIFSLYCKGNINNYRLYNYGGDESRTKLEKLHYLANNSLGEDMAIRSNTAYENLLYSPYFVYDQQDTVIKTFKQKLGLDYEFVKKFWDENPEYRFIKPVNGAKLADWLKVKFYDRAFIEAYTKVSRTRMTMRLSRFVNDRCTKFYMDEKFYPVEESESEDIDCKKEKINAKFLTIKECYDRLVNEQESVKLGNPTKTLLKADSTATSIYDYLDRTLIFHNDYASNPNRTIGCLTPHKPTWVYLENNVGTLLQYLLNKKNFVLDKRRIKSELSLSKDVEKISEYFDLNKKLSPTEVQSLYNDLVISKDRRILYMGFSRNSDTLGESLSDQFCFNISKRRIYAVNSSSIPTMQNPFNEKKYYIATQSYGENTYQQCLETMSLMYAILRRRYNMDVFDIKNLLNGLLFKTKNGEDEVLSNWRDILNVFHPQFFESIPSHINLRKQAAFLRKVLMNQDDTLNELTNDAYSYAYHYEKMGTMIDNSYVGETVCIFIYLNQTFRFIQQDNKIPKMFTNTKNHVLNKSAWWVCLKLANIITDREFRYRLFTYDIRKYLGKIKKEAYCFMGYSNGKVYWEYNLCTEGLPIHYTKTEIPKVRFEKRIRNDVLPTANDYNMTVYMGRNKLYKLPYWVCRQYDVVVCREDYNLTLEGIKIQEFFKHELFENILKERQPRNLKWEEIEVCQETYNFALKHIVKCKLEIECFKNSKLYNEIENERSEMLEDFKKRKERNTKFDDSFEIRFTDEQRLLEEKKERMRKMVSKIMEGMKKIDFSEVEIIPLEESDDEIEIYDDVDMGEKYFNEGILEESGVELIKDEEEESYMMPSANIINFGNYKPVRTTQVELKKNIYGPIKNIYNYKPILFNILLGEKLKMETTASTCFSNCYDLVRLYENTGKRDFSTKTYIMYLFYYYLAITGGDETITPGKYHMKKTYKRFNLCIKKNATKEQMRMLVKKKGKEFVRRRTLVRRYQDDKRFFIIKEIGNFEEYMLENKYVNYNGYEKLYEKIVTNMENYKEETDTDILDFFEDFE